MQTTVTGCAYGRNLAQMALEVSYSYSYSYVLHGDTDTAVAVAVAVAVDVAVPGDIAVAGADSGSYCYWWWRCWVQCALLGDFHGQVKMLTHDQKRPPCICIYSVTQHTHGANEYE